MPINAVIIPHIPTSVMRARVSRRHLARRSITKQCFFRPVCQCGDNPVDVLFGQRTARSGLWKPQAWEVQRRRIWQRQVKFGYSCTPCNCISSTILLAAAPPLPYPRQTKNAIKWASKWNEMRLHGAPPMTRHRPRRASPIINAAAMPRYESHALVVARSRHYLPAQAAQTADAAWEHRVYMSFADSSPWIRSLRGISPAFLPPLLALSWITAIVESCLVYHGSSYKRRCQSTRRTHWQRSRAVATRGSTPWCCATSGRTRSLHSASSSSRRTLRYTHRHIHLFPTPLCHLWIPTWPYIDCRDTKTNLINLTGTTM